MEKIVLFLLVSTLSSIVAALAQEDPFIGVNIRTAAPSTPSPTEIVELLKAERIEQVRLYDADANMLVALANTTIRVAISIPNDQLLNISQSNSTAKKWISQNVLTHYPSTNITTICVGSNPNLAPFLINALKNIHLALMAFNLDKKIKISTPVDSTIIINSFPPSGASFNRSFDQVLIPMLKFLQTTNSHFMISIYPYFDFVKSKGVYPLDYALFNPIANTSLRYSNAFDAAVGAAYSAMANLNITNVTVVVSETGWPSRGGADEPYATSENAKTYNTNLINHVLNKSGSGVSAYIYELYSEDAKEGSDWGLFEPNGDSIYTVEFDGVDSSSSSANRNETYCAAKAGADEKSLQAALDWACGDGKVDCSPLMEGQPCFEPDTLSAHATYAFDSYYRQMGRAEGSCDFNGVATITSISPDHGSCMISVTGSDKNGSRMNSTDSAAMDSESSYSSGSLSYGYGDAVSAAKVVVGLVGCVALLF